MKYLSVLILLTSCKVLSKDKNKIVVNVFNTKKDYAYFVSAKVQILTEISTSDSRCSDRDSSYYFGLSTKRKSGYILTGMDTIFLLCASKDDLTATDKHVVDALFKPSRTGNNFWVNYDFNYMSLAEMDSIINNILRHANGIYYYCPDGKVKFIQLQNPVITYNYFFDGKKVLKTDSFFYNKMNVPPAPAVRSVQQKNDSDKMKEKDE